MDIFDYIREELLVEQEELNESLKGIARRVTKKLKDPLRKKAYKRASDLESSLTGQIYHLRRAGKSGVAKPETVKKLRKKLETNRDRAGWVKAKAFYPKQMKGKTVFDRR